MGAPIFYVTTENEGKANRTTRALVFPLRHVDAENAQQMLSQRLFLFEKWSSSTS